jgi:hypothetical protein
VQPCRLHEGLDSSCVFCGGKENLKRVIGMLCHIPLCLLRTSQLALLNPNSQGD